MLKQSAEQIKNNLSNEGVTFKSFTLTSEGDYAFDDADWNYKDIPHLKHVHNLVESHPTFASDNQVNHIIFQKIPPFFRFPMCVTNYDYNKDTQIYYASFLFYILVIKTKIISLGKNKTRVDTEYNIGSTSKIFGLFFPILKFLIKRNYKDLMKGDIPMRTRRGELRKQGYNFSKKFVDGKISYTETTQLHISSVQIPKNLRKTYRYKINLNDLKIKKNILLGPDNDSGLRIIFNQEKIYFYRRICHHQGACLTNAKIRKNKIYCPWHGQGIRPILIVDNVKNKLSNNFIRYFPKNEFAQIEYKVDKVTNVLQ